MSLTGAASKVTGAAASAGAGAALAGAAAPSTSIWTILVLGIPLGVLVASLCGAAVRQIREHGQPDANIPRRAIAIVTDGFIGGWLAMLLVGIPLTRDYFGNVEHAIVGALCALGLQFMRDKGPKLFDQAAQVVLGRFSRPPGPPPQGGPS